MTQQAKKNGAASFSRSSAHASWLSAVMLIAPLSLLGELLIAKTHHRPLGAATFATIAIVLWAFVEFVSRRLLDAEICSRRARARRWMWVASISWGALVVFRALV
jgi:hypothetical protein